MIPMKVCIGSRTVEGTSITTVIGENEGISSLLAELPITRKGSGTPSASNIRPFVLWDEVTIYDADDNAIYHGTFDAVPKGEVRVLNGKVVSDYGYIPSYNGEELSGIWYSDRDADGSSAPTLGAEVVYVLDQNVGRDIEISESLPDYAEGDTFSVHGEGKGYLFADGYAEGSIANIPPAETVTEDGVTYTPTSRNAKSVVIGIEPKQSGSGTPSPDNVRPISGWTGAEVTRTGKNLLGESIGRYTWASGVRYPVYSGPYCAVESKFAVKGGQTYSVSFTNSATTNGVYVGWLNGDTHLSQSAFYNATSETVTAPSNATHAVITFRNAADYTGSPTVSNVMFELGSTATAYEPYQGTTYPISWQTEAGTVYGGTLDVTSGELVVDRAMVSDFSNVVIGRGSTSTSGEYRARIEISDIKSSASVSVADSMLKCNALNTLSANQTYTANIGISLDTNGYIYAYVSGLNTIDAYRNWLTQNSVVVVYPLATPITYHLTPTDIALLQGTNNVWADCGDTEVTYSTLFDTEMIPNLEAEIGSYKEYEGTMCGKRHIPNFPTNPLVKPLLKAVVNGENALMTTDCVEVAPCGAEAIVCEATVCNTVVACDE